MTLNVLDLVNKKVIVREIKTYNKKTCALEGVKHPTEDLFAIPDGQKVPKLHGGYCISEEDFNKIKASVEAECVNERDNKKP